MSIRRLQSTDAFVVVDLDDAETSVGVARLARKIAPDGAELLARSITYGMASFGLEIGGASAGINATPEGRDEALAAFVAEVPALTADKTLALYPGSGVKAADLSALDATLAGRAAVAAADAVLGGLSGARLAVVGKGPEASAAKEAAVAAGADPADGELEAPCDALLVAGKVGTVDHEVAAAVKARALVPLTPVPVTAKALAMLAKAGTVVVPDFLTTLAPLLAVQDGAGGDPVERVRTSVAGVAAAGVESWLAACSRAEDFLRGWRAELPFGRPLA
ncbi:MAG: hypothetical protein ACRD0U_10405 [Acidimicrobiales bacterium]